MTAERTKHQLQKQKQDIQGVNVKLLEPWKSFRFILTSDNKTVTQYDRSAAVTGVSVRYFVQLHRSWRVFGWNIISRHRRSLSLVLTTTTTGVFVGWVGVGLVLQQRKHAFTPPAFVNILRFKDRSVVSPHQTAVYGGAFAERNKYCVWRRTDDDTLQKRTAAAVIESTDVSARQGHWVS